MNYSLLICYFELSVISGVYYKILKRRSLNEKIYRNGHGVFNI